MDEQLKKLSDMIERAKRMVFLGGAGVSTESGISDFRSENGVYAALKSYGRPPEELLSHGFFIRHPDIFFDYYKKHLICPDAKPNAAHKALAKLERMGKLTAIVTQNIDELHQRGGSKTVFELHGSVYRNHCMRCGRFYDVSAVLKSDGVPKCSCGGIIKPDVVLYGESLPEHAISGAIDHIERADFLLIGGTQLSVYPAAGLVDYFAGRDLAVINLTATPRDASAALTVRRPIGEVLQAVVGI